MHFWTLYKNSELLDELSILLTLGLNVERQGISIEAGIPWHYNSFDRWCIFNCPGVDLFCDISVSVCMYV